jgi:hypothetical protein
MKVFTNALWVFLTLLVCTKPILAQSQIEFEVSDSARRAERLYFKESQGYYTFGIHGGYSYQSSDVSNLYKGWGLALTLEKNFIHNRGGYLDLGIRARAMYANSFGLNTRPFTGTMDLNYAVNGKYNPNANYIADGLYFANYRNDFGELGLEGVLTFNHLRETKGILLSLYGGLGLNVYYVGTDQTDANDAKYKYLTINQNQSVAAIRQQLLAMRDGTYETSGDAFDDVVKVDVMPNVGIELGYQLTPNFSIGIGHRLMFTQTNLFDGQQWENNNTISPRNDLHHFTSLDFKWIVSGTESQTKPPKITIYRPDQNPYSTYNATETVQARISGIETGADVTFKVNGIEKPFNYYSKEFIATVNVDAPSNECVITARNRSGSATEKVILIKSVKVGNPTTPSNPTPTPTPTPKPDPISTTPTVLLPTVQITTPSGISVTETSVIDFRATTRYIDRKDQVTLTLNNYPLTDFTFYNNNVTSRLNLREGANQVLITVRNSAGQATDRYSITLNRPRPQIPLPTVNVNMESSVKGNEAGCEADWYANVQNVSNRNQLRVTLNGNAINDWNFNNGRLSGRARLQSGNNRIHVEARNETGSATGDAATNCTIERTTLLPPAVTVRMEPNAKGNESGCEQDWTASVQNVSNRNEIRVYLNGAAIDNWTFNNNRLNGRARLRSGENRMNIEVRNDGGTATGEAVANCDTEKPRPLPPSVSVKMEPNAKGNESGCEQDWTASVQNVSNRNEIRVYLNGAAIDNWSFNNNRLNGRARLRSGENRMNVEVRNEGGTATGEAVANCDIEKPRPLPPAVSVKMESFVKGNESGCDNNWYATVKNVSNRNDIKVYLNGSPITNWDFANDRITGRARLRSGENRINVEVKNEVGAATGESVSHCDTEKPRPIFPSVRISVEGNVQGDNNGCRTAFSAAIQHVTNKNDLTVSLNGNNLYDWQFDERTGTIRGNLNLKLGNNLLRVGARNESGEARDETDIYCNAKKMPPSVRFTRPAEGTRTLQAEVAVEATVLNVQKGAIILKLNTIQIRDFDFDENRKVLRVTVPLTIGVNTLRLSAQNQDGSDDAQLAVIRIEEVREKRPPRVTITAPQNNAVMPTPEAVVKAALLNITTESQVTMYLNDAKFTEFKIDKLFRNLTAKVPLREGNNLVTVRVENEDGNNQSSVNIIYNLPKPPVVRITSPADGAVYETQNVTTVKANLENVNGKEGVRAYLNGNSVQFSVTNNVLTVGCNMQPGENTVRIAVSNSGGNAEDRIKMFWNRPQPPTATIVNPPAPVNILESQTLNFEGRVTNTEKSGVSLMVNGNFISNFTFDNGTITAPLNLNAGKNVISLGVNSKGGSANAEAIANVVIPTDEVLPDRPLPIAGVSVSDLVLTRPVIDVLDPKPAATTLTATVTGVQKSDIMLNINGNNITDFQYNAKSHLLTYSFPIQSGQSYTVTVQAANKSGRAEKIETIRF